VRREIAELTYCGRRRIDSAHQSQQHVVPIIVGVLVFCHDEDPLDGLS
jgi:hypothetical protein